jgi:hypothetical protein
MVGLKRGQRNLVPTRKQHLQTVMCWPLSDDLIFIAGFEVHAPAACIGFRPLHSDVLCCAVVCYRDIDLQFSGSREDVLLNTCREALSAADEKAFATAVAEFDSLTRLDTWKTNMLLRVKRRLQARSAGQEAGENSEDELL